MSRRAAGRGQTDVLVAGPESASEPEPEPTPRVPTPRIAHQPALDGLRGIAVLCVLVFHNGRVEPLGGSLPGGFLGVDLFFVLSGYLITTLLLAEHESNGRIGLVAFWGRPRRLLPALFLVLLLIAAYGAFAASPAEMDRIRGDVFATLLYVQNWHVVSLNAAFGSALGHTWSLSVEEQWYVIWPLLFAGLAVLFRRNKHRMAIVLGLAALALTAWTWFLHENGATRGRMFYGTDTRITPVLVGATLAFILARSKRVHPGDHDSDPGLPDTGAPPKHSDGQHWLEAAGIAGAVWVGWFILTSRPNNAFMYRGGYLLFAIATACIIAASVHPRSQVLGPILSWRGIGAIGIVSYGVYLYHQPIFFWITPDRVPLDGFVIIFLRFAVTAALATASFFFVERRFRHAHLKPAVSWILIPAAAIIAIGAVVVATSAKPEKVFAEPPSTANPATIIALRGIGASAAPGSTKVLVAGDGSAFGLGAAVENRYRGDGVVGTTFADLQCSLAEGTLIVFGQDAKGLPTCHDWPDQYRTAVEAFQPDVTALMIGNREPFSRIIAGETVEFGGDEWEEQSRAELDRAREGLTATGAPLMLLTVPCPAQGQDVGSLAPEQRSTQRIGRINRVLREYAEDHAPDVTVADLNETLCGPGSPPAPAEPGLRTDYLHFTPAGADRTWAWLGEQAQQVVGARG